MIVTSQRVNANTVKIFVAGRIDTVHAAEFRREVMKISLGVRKIIFDFRDVEYVSSSGLREILICQKNYSIVQIENVRREIYQLFLMAGFDKFIAVNKLTSDARA